MQMTESALRDIATPRTAMWLCLVVLAGTGWAYLGTFNDFIQAICRTNRPTSTLWEGELLLSMWLAMSLAMRLPTAAPMISTYLDIAEAAEAKRISVAPPFTLVAGYGAVWVLFAVFAALSQLAVAPWLLAPGSAVSGAVLIFAGLY